MLAGCPSASMICQRSTGFVFVCGDVVGVGNRVGSQSFGCSRCGDSSPGRCRCAAGSSCGQPEFGSASVANDCMAAVIHTQPSNRVGAVFIATTEPRQTVPD